MPPALAVGAAESPNLAKNAYDAIERLASNSTRCGTTLWTKDRDWVPVIRTAPGDSLSRSHTTGTFALLVLALLVQAAIFRHSAASQYRRT
jgi:hypothetical protein